MNEKELIKIKEEKNPNNSKRQYSNIINARVIETVNNKENCKIIKTPYNNNLYLVREDSLIVKSESPKRDTNKT